MGNRKSIKNKALVTAAIFFALTACASKPVTAANITPLTSAQINNKLDTASGPASITVNSPAGIVGDSNATSIALGCEAKANSAKTSGQADAASQNVYYDCLQSAFNVAN